MDGALAVNCCSRLAYNAGNASLGVQTKQVHVYLWLSLLPLD